MMPTTPSMTSSIYDVYSRVVVAEPSCCLLASCVKKWEMFQKARLHSGGRRSQFD
jgi:hypothetical protein